MAENALQDIDVDALDPAPDNPRVKVKNLRELSDSLGAVGVIEPLLVAPTTPGRYMIVAGHRRHAAAKLAGLSTVPCIVRRDLSEPDRIATMVAENLHRNGLTVAERAVAYKRLMDEHGLTQTEVARRVGVSLANVNYALSKLEDPAERTVRLQDLRERRLAGEAVHGRPPVATTPQEIVDRLRECATGNVGSLLLNYAQCRVLMRMVAEGARAVARERARYLETGELPTSGSATAAAS